MFRIKKTLVCITLAMLMVLSVMPACASAASYTSVQYADALYELGLFSGTGTNADGSPIYSLDRAPSRAEAITMLVRLLGKEAEATSKSWDMPFDDVDDWAKPYVGYAYNNGLTSGVGATKFGSKSKASEAQYITFILRALGYSDTDGDFEWNNSKVLSNELGITEGETNSNFLRADIVEISYYALDTAMKNSEDRLIDVLYSNQAVSTTQIPKVFRTRKSDDGTKIYLPEEAIDGVSFKDLARACGCSEDLHYITDPKTEADHLNNVQYIMLTAQWSYKKSDNSSAARTSWGNCDRTPAGKMKVYGQLQVQMFGVFQNYWCEFYYENGGYTLYCSIDPVLSPKDIQTYLVEAYKIIDAKHNEFVKKGKISDKSTDYQIVKAYSDWMTDHYDTVTPRSVGFPEASKTETAYGFLGLRHTNCQGIAAAVAMAWNYEGIPAYGVISGYVPGSWEGHIQPWTVIDGQEYSCEAQRHPGLFKVSADGSISETRQYLSPFYIAMARKDMGLSFDKAYDYTDPNILDIVPKCQAAPRDIPFTSEYIKTNEDGMEEYLVKIDGDYTEAAEQKYQVYLTTCNNNGIKTMSGFYKLDLFKEGVTVRVTKEQRLDALPYGMDKFMIRVQ